MDFRCSNCEHVGPAVDVRQTPDGVVLVCENCEHPNVLDVATAVDAEDSPTGSQVDFRPAAPTSAVGEDDSVWLKQGALKRLVPEPGDGPRCRKCARLLRSHEQHCARCGLSVAEAESYPEGEAPWERPPAGKEAEQEQASLLWKALRDNPTDENLSKFVGFVREEELLEYGVRKLRLFLIDHPEDDAAVDFLRELASSFQARIVVAQAKAQIRADDFVQKTGRFKQILLWIVFVVWGVIFVVFLANVMDGCG